MQTGKNDSCALSVPLTEIIEPADAQFEQYVCKWVVTDPSDRQLTEKPAGMVRPVAPVEPAAPAAPPAARVCKPGFIKDLWRVSKQVVKRQ